MPSSEDSLAQVRRLARLLATEDGQRTFLELQKIRGRSDPETAAASIWPSGENVGIYLREGEQWVRDEARRHQWRFWADVECLPPKGERQRVVWLGESAARGYFFDPAFTPAAQLALSLPDYEVIDLARTDAGAADMANLILECIVLSPDVIVLFAGNNWTQSTLDEVSATRWATALREESPAAIRAAADASLAEKAKIVISVLALAARCAGCRVVGGVGESNTIDWRDDPDRFVPYLRGERTLAWWEALGHARSALQRGESRQAAEHASRMESLDGGLSDLAPRLRAEALRGQGEEALAVSALGAARDAMLGRFEPVAPRSGQVVQSFLRGGARAAGFDCVDLPALFDAPDRRVFLDYCHLTREGLNVAMRAVAHKIQPAARVVEAPLSASDHAWALFLAALHNAHHGQSLDVVRHHLNRARALDAQINTAAQAWLACRSHLRPAWIGAPYGELSRSRLARRYLDAHDPRGTEQVSEFTFAQAVGEEALASYAASLADVLGASVDLLNPTLFARSLVHFRGLSIAEPRTYHCAYGPTSIFLLPLNRPADLHLQAVLRLPPGQPGSGEVRLRVNGHRLSNWTVGERWQRVQAAIPSTALKKGVQRIELVWPIRKPDSQAALERAARTVERMSAPELNPLFGAIDRLCVTPSELIAPTRS